MRDEAISRQGGWEAFRQTRAQGLGKWAPKFPVERRDSVPSHGNRRLSCRYLPTHYGGTPNRALAWRRNRPCGL